jgi:hypothetical protein
MNARHLIGALAIAASLAAADSARAGTASVDLLADGYELIYQAAPGERNDVVVEVVSVASDPAGTLRQTVTDTGAPVTAGPGCLPVDAHTATCERSFMTRVAVGDLDDRVTVRLAGPGDRLVGTIDAGAGDDQIVGASIHYQLLGGGGDDETQTRPRRDRFSPGDVMFGGPGDDVLRGSYAEDVLDGGGGHDELYGAAGADRVSDGDLDGAPPALGPDADLLDGGKGPDTVSYQQRTSSVIVDISDAAPDGEPGEGDRLTGIESIIGGQGADRLVGNERRNALDGQGGRDDLRGRARRDTFTRGGGTISCGSGPDTVSGGVDPGEIDHLRRSCEQLETASLDTLPAYPGRTTPTSVGFRVLCPHLMGRAHQRPCAPFVQLRERSGEQRLIGRGRLPRSARPKSRLLVARLTALGRELAASEGGVPVLVRISDYYRPPRSVQWSIALHVKAGT